MPKCRFAGVSYKTYCLPQMETGMKVKTENIRFRGYYRQPAPMCHQMAASADNEVRDESRTDRLTHNENRVEFTQNHDWRVSKKIEEVKEDMTEAISARLKEDFRLEIGHHSKMAESIGALQRRVEQLEKAILLHQNHKGMTGGPTGVTEQTSESRPDE